MFFKVEAKADYVQKFATHADLGREVWISWDKGAQVYELWASDECSDYVGCADTLDEAKGAVGWWFDDLQCY